MSILDGTRVISPVAQVVRSDAVAGNHHDRWAIAWIEQSAAEVLQEVNRLRSVALRHCVKNTWPRC